MKKLMLALVFLFPVILLAQVVPAPVIQGSPAPVALVSPALIALVSCIVLSLNTALSGVQTIFAQWSKQEPGWLQSISKFILAVSKFLGSNPSV